MQSEYSPVNHVWSYDFQQDRLLSGRKIRLFSILDEFTREWLSVTVGVSLTSQEAFASVAEAQGRLGTHRQWYAVV